MGEINWVAQYNAKDDIDEKIIRLGIRQEGHLAWIYFDFDENDPDLCANTKEEAKAIIQEKWGYMDTFDWIKY